MSEITDTPATPAQLAARLAGLIHGPYADTSTAAAADLVAEGVRYLNYALPRGGVTEPATVATVAANLATAVYRLPQALTAISEWLKAETAAGRIADDHHRPPADLTALIRAAISQATDDADNLAVTLAAVNRLTATLHGVIPAAPAPRTGDTQ